jgi:phosphohistidine phosphatase
MRALLVRHGPAGDRFDWSERGLDDDLRPLTAEGAEKCRRAFRRLPKLAGPLNTIAASPLVRAVQTADLLAAVFPSAGRARTKTLGHERDPAEAMRWLARRDPDESIALVGHEPHLGRLLATMLANRAAPLADFKKGACALVEFDGKPETGEGRLVWMLQPKALRALR